MTRHQKRMLKQAAKQICLHILFIVICFVTLIPILYALSVSLNADNSLVSSDFRFIPKNFTLRNYVAVFTEEPVMLWFKNSMTLAVVTVVISLAAAIPAAYAFSRMRFKGRKPILKQLVLLYSFPSVLSMFAIYTLLRPLGLINSKAGLILIYTGTMAEFGLLNMKGYFDTIPREIEEAAEIDGANPLVVLFRILIPLTIPTIAVLILYYAVANWNSWFNAMLFLPKAKEKWPLQLVLRNLLIQNQTDDLTSGVAAADKFSVSETIKYATIIVSTLPILCLYPFLQKYFLKGVMVGSVKG